MRKYIVVAAFSLSLFMAGCTSPSPESYLAAAASAVDIAAALPGLSPADVMWLDAAASGISCSSTVLGQMLSPSTEALAIAGCFKSLPVIPAGDQPYISAAISTVQLFIDLFVPSENAIALKANVASLKLNAAGRSRLAAVLSDINAKSLGTSKRLKSTVIRGR